MGPRNGIMAAVAIAVLPGCDLVFGLQTLSTTDAGPSPLCAASPTTTVHATWTFVPDPPSTASALVVTFGDTIPYTNVALKLCEPTGMLLSDMSATVTGHFAWTFEPIQLPAAGVTQLQFHADPNDEVIATLVVTVQ